MENTQFIVRCLGKVFAVIIFSCLMSCQRCAYSNNNSISIKESIKRLTTIEKQHLLDAKLFLQLEDSVSVFAARAITKINEMQPSSVTRTIYQGYQVKEHFWGMELKGKITLEAIQSIGSIRYEGESFDGMESTEKGADVIALIHLSDKGHTVNDKPVKIVTRILPDTLDNRKQVFIALEFLTNNFTVPLPAWAGENVEAVVTARRDKLNAEGETFYHGRLGIRSRYDSTYKTEIHTLKEYVWRISGYDKFSVSYRKGRDNPYFLVDYANDSKSTCVVFPDYDRLNLFRISFNDFKKKCHESAEISEYTRFQIKEGLSIYMFDLAIIIPAYKEFFRQSNESKEQWEARIMEVIKLRPDKHESFKQPEYPTKLESYNQLSCLHGQEGLDLLLKIAKELDPIAEQFVKTDKVTVK